MLTFNLKPIFKARGIQRPYTFLIKAGLSPHSATKISNNGMSVLRLDHVELLCKLLVCEPNDLLYWRPEEGEIYAENNPLKKLGQSYIDNNWREVLSATPLNELNEMMKKVVDKDM